MPGGRSKAVRDDVCPRVLPSKVLELGTGVPRMSLESGRKWGSGGPRGLRDAIKVGTPCVAPMNLGQRKGIEKVDVALFVRQENGYAVSGKGFGQPGALSKHPGERRTNSTKVYAEGKCWSRSQESLKASAMALL